jgi:hypothetical protein
MSSDRYTVIPTRYGRPTVVPLLEVCKQVAQTIVVLTEPDLPQHEGTISVDGTFSASIQAWWNAGLDRCTGPTLILNDDVVATPDALGQMFDALETADVVYLAGHRVGHRTPLTGWCYGIHPDRIRPSNDFQWWAGDDDLYLRAVRGGLTVTAVDIPTIRHERAQAPFENPVHAAMVDADMNLLHERWG